MEALIDFVENEFVAKKEMIKRHSILVPSCDPDEHINLYFFHSEER